MKHLYDMFKDWCFNRHTISVAVLMGGVDEPTVCVRITNQTPAHPVFVRRVRVHYGNDTFSRAFVLMPDQRIEIRPKDRAEWLLDYDNTVVVETTVMKAPVAPIPHRHRPGIDTPSQLFNAIGMGRSSDSWIEVDFNEYDHRRYCRGRVKTIFDMVGKSINANRAAKR